MRSFPLYRGPPVGALLLFSLLATSCGATAQSKVESPQSRAAITKYRSYLKDNSAELTHWALAIAAKVREDAVTKAESRYAAARVPYGHVEPAARLFRNLNSQIDGTGTGDAVGFHRLEKAFFAKSTTAGMHGVAMGLLANVKALQRRLGMADLKPARIIGGASELLDEVSTSTVAGEEERYAHIDLVDIAADLEGLNAAFEAVEPLIVEGDPDLATEMEGQFRQSYAKVGEYGILAENPEQARDREPGISFVVYSELSEDEVHEIAQGIDALAELFSRAQDEIDGL